jgi:hypothetical protein
MGGRAEHPGLHGGYLERPDIERAPCSDTQEIAKLLTPGTYFMAVQAKFMSKLSAITASLV